MLAKVCRQGSKPLEPLCLPKDMPTMTNTPTPLPTLLLLTKLPCLRHRWPHKWPAPSMIVF
jgi:hypothetical protein